MLMWTRMARSTPNNLTSCARRLLPCPADLDMHRLGRQSMVATLRSTLAPARPCLTQLTASGALPVAGLVR